MGFLHSPPNPFRQVPFPRNAAGPHQRSRFSKTGRFGKTVADLSQTISHWSAADRLILKEDFDWTVKQQHEGVVTGELE
jgi:hypothetical protein